MKVKVDAVVTIHEHVEITLEHITAALKELEGTPESTHALEGLLTVVWNCMVAVPDRMIAKMTPLHKRVVRDALTKQAIRYVDHEKSD